MVCGLLGWREVGYGLPLETEMEKGARSAKERDERKEMGAVGTLRCESPKYDG